MSSIKLKGSSSGDVTITVPAAAGTNTVTIPAASGTLPLSNLDHVTNRRNANPIIINGDMQVAQRSTSVTGITASGFHTVDRMNLAISSFGTWTQTQDTTVPTAKGFTKSLKMDCTTAETSPSAGDYLAFQAKIEAQDLQMLKYGTSSAEALTLKFYVRSPKTGTHIVHFYSPDGNRHISKAYTISSADTFQEVIINIPGDTGGTINNDNGLGFNIEWYFGAGSNSTSGTLATSWASYVNANVAVGQVNCADSTDNNFFITGIQLEVGDFDVNSIPSFQHESFGDSLLRCQRYLWQEKNDTGSTKYSTIGLAQGTGRGYGVWQFSEMRAAPTVSVSDVGEFLPLNGAGGVQADFTTVTNSLSTKTMVFLDLSGSSGLTSGQACPIGINDGHYVRGDAEL